MALSEKAKKAKNAYMREYRKKKKQELEEYQNRYWEQKAEEMGISEDKTNN